MAKVNGPLHSIAATGSFAKTLSFGSLHGKPWVGKMHKASGEPSVAQKAARQVFSDAKDAWLALTDMEKEVYNERAKEFALTGYNLFLREYTPEDMKKVVVTLTNDQILGLNSTPVQILPAPPTGKVFVPIVVLFSVDTEAAGYTNVNSDVYLALTTDDWYDTYSAQFTPTILTTARKQLCISNTSGVTDFGGHGPIMTHFDLVGSYDNPINLFCDNQGDGDFTGGDPANTIKVTLFYEEVDY